MLGLGMAAALRGQAVLEASLDSGPVPPGNVAVCRVRGLAPQGLTLAGFRQEAGFYYSKADDAQVALLAVPLGTRPGRKQVELSWPGATPQRLWLQVAKDRAPRQKVRVSGLKRKMKKAVRSGDREVLDHAVAKAGLGPPLWKGRFQWPLAGEVVVTSGFGSRRDYNRGSAAWRHKGVDLRAAEGTPVLAANDGTVLLARRRLSLTGGSVILGHGYGLSSSYFHLSKVEVKAGQAVKKGQRLGLSGSTGLSSGPHLHWQMDLRGVPVSPQQWLQSDPGGPAPPAPLP